LAEGLPRLPPGRHGLDRAFVVRNQRDRLTAGVIAVVARKGYWASTITEICAEAGLSRRTFYSYFGGKEECFLDAVELVMGYLFASAREAAADAEDWPSAVRVRMLALLEVFAANADLVRFGWVAPLRAGQGLLPVYHQNIDGILALLNEGRPADTDRRPPRLIQQSIVAGTMALLAARVEAEDEEEPRLTELLSDLVEIFLAQYLDREKAMVVASGSA